MGGSLASWSGGDTLVSINEDGLCAYVKQWQMQACSVRTGKHRYRPNLYVNSYGNQSRGTLVSTERVSDVRQLNRMQNIWPNLFCDLAAVTLEDREVNSFPEIGSCPWNSVNMLQCFFSIHLNTFKVKISHRYFAIASGTRVTVMRFLASSSSKMCHKKLQVRCRAGKFRNKHLQTTRVQKTLVIAPCNTFHFSHFWHPKFRFSWELPI